MKVKTIFVSGLLLYCLSICPAFAYSDVQVINLVPADESVSSVNHVIKNSYIEGSLYIIDENNSITPYNNIDITNTYIGGDLVIYQYTKAGFTEVSPSEISDFRGFVPVVL